MSTCVAALYAAAGGAPATTPAQDLVDTWASGGAGSDGFAMVFEDAGGTDAPSIYVKDSGTPANDKDINLTDDFDAFNSFLTYTSPSPKIVRQSDGNLKYCAHNLYLNSASPANQSITVTSGATYAVTITGSVSVTASGAATGTWTAGTNTFTAATTTLTLGSTSGSGTVHVYRTPADTTYLATTGSIRYALPIQHDSSNNAEGLLVEPASTNLLEGSSDFSTHGWLNVNSAESAASESLPDGTTGGWTLSSQTSSGRHIIFNQTLGLSTVQYCLSFIVKQGTGRYVQVQHTDATSRYGVIFDLQLGTAGDVESSGSPTGTGSGIQSLGNGWYRCYVSKTYGSGTAYPNISISNSATPVYDSNGNPTFTGSSETIHLFHAQLELGSAPTSPIITTGATATRAKDQFTTLNTDFPYADNAAGSYYIKFNVLEIDAPYFFDNGDAGSTASTRVAAFAVGSSIRGFVTGTGDDTLGETFSVNTDTKYALAYDTNDYAHTSQGNTVETDATSTNPTGATVMNIGMRGNQGNQLLGLVKEFMYLPERVSNTDLESITT